MREKIKRIVKPIITSLPAKAEWDYTNDRRGAIITIDTKKLNNKERNKLLYLLQKQLKQGFAGICISIEREYEKIFISVWHEWGKGNVKETELFNIINTCSKIIQEEFVEEYYEFTLPLSETSTWPPKMRA